MNPNTRFSDLTPSGSVQSRYTRYTTHITSSDGSNDWIPMKVVNSNTWASLVRRARGEAQ
jgi:hypothetical protein